MIWSWFGTGVDTLGKELARNVTKAAAKETAKKVVKQAAKKVA